jgi:hypothetical protein
MQNLIFVVFMVCLKASPSHCHEEQVQSSITMQACETTLASQPVIIGWIEEHPNYYLKGGWRCSESKKEPS